MEKKAIIFDMDGVLVDSEPFYLNSFQEFIEKHHGNVIPSVLHAIAGASAKQTWIYVSQMWPEPITPENVRKIYKQEYTDFQIPYKEALFPGIQMMLSELKQMGFCLALASSSSEEAIKKMLAETNLESYFSCLVSGKWFKDSKPNPAIYLHTLKLLDLTPEECIAVEDSTYGIQAAKNAGIQVIAVKDSRFSFDQSEADDWVEKTVDLVEIVRKK